MGTDQLVGDVCLDKRFFKSTRLRVRAVQNRKVIIAAMFFLDLFLNVLDDEIAFVSRVVGPIVSNFFAGFVFGPKRLVLAIEIMLDHFVCSLQDRFRRAVVLFKFDDGGILVIFFKVQDVFHVGTTPSVDALIGIADDAKVAKTLRQHVDQTILRFVRILIFVDMNVTEFALIEFERFRRAFKQLDRLHDQIIKVHRLIFLQFVLIYLISTRSGNFHGIRLCICLQKRFFWFDQFILPSRN